MTPDRFLAAELDRLLPAADRHRVHLAVTALPVPLRTPLPYDASVWAFMTPRELVLCVPDDPDRIRLDLAAMLPHPDPAPVVRRGVLVAAASRIAVTLADPADRAAVPSGCLLVLDLTGSRPERVTGSTFRTEAPHPHSGSPVHAGSSRLAPVSAPYYRGRSADGLHAVEVRSGRAVESVTDVDAGRAEDRATAAAWASFALFATDPRRWTHADGVPYVPVDASPAQVVTALRGEWESDAHVVARRADDRQQALIPASWVHADVEGVYRAGAIHTAPGQLVANALLRLVETWVVAQGDTPTDALDGVVLHTAGHAVAAGWTHAQAARRLGGAPPAHRDLGTDPVGGPPAVVAAFARLGLTVWLVPLCPDRRLCVTNHRAMVAVAAPPDAKPHAVPAAHPRVRLPTMDEVRPQGGAPAVWAVPGRICVGPLPPVGCVTCARTRRSRTDPTAADTVPVPNVARLADLVAAVGSDLPADRQVWAEQDLHTLDLTYVTALRDPLCVTCAGGGPPDSPVRARLDLTRAAATNGRYGWRSRTAASLLPVLRDTYVDPHAGLVTGTEVVRRDGFTFGSATTPEPGGPGYESWGFTPDPLAAEATALLEALERHGGEAPRGFRPVVHATVAEVMAAAADGGPRAVHPRRYGTHDIDRTAVPHFPVPPLTEDTVYEWVWGWSLVADAAVLVPRSLAFYTVPGDGSPPPEYPPLAQEVSSGGAIGTSDSEACIAGLLEAVERDAFLVTWYRRLRLPEIDPDSLPPALRAEAATVANRLRATVHLFDNTMEHGVPSVLAVSRANDRAEAQFTCVGGAGLTPVEAVSRALAELGPITVGNRQRYSERRDEAAAMVADPDLVRWVTDHPLPTCHPDGADRLDFLRFEAARPLAHGRTINPGTALTELVERLARVTDDVIAVRQTTPEHEAAGLSVVKVLVPQLVPITFGHRMRRTGELARLWSVPDRLGLHAAPGLNPHPHPLP